MNVELTEHLELKDDNKKIIRFTIELNTEILEGLTEEQKESFFKFYDDEILMGYRITQSRVNKYLYKLRHPDDFK